MCSFMNHVTIDGNHRSSAHSSKRKQIRYITSLGRAPGHTYPSKDALDPSVQAFKSRYTSYITVIVLLLV